MNKKEKTKRNVFGLVSKLGNLIKKGTTTTNTDNVDTSAGENDIPKRNFNIHISEDNQEEIEIGDEEEEEEEEENEQEKKKDLNDIKEDKKNIEEKNKENKDANNINNEVNMVQNDNDNNNKLTTNNKEEIKTQEIKEETINKEKEKNQEEKNDTQKEKEEIIQYNKIVSNDKNVEIKNEIKEEKLNSENNINNNEKSDFIEEEEIKEEDINEACHLYLKKGNDFNYKEIYCIPITQIKNPKKKSILQKMNLFKKSKTEIINYKIFFEENFIYFAKDIIINKKDDALRRIYKTFNIRNISNYIGNKETESNKYKITFDVINKKFLKKRKEYYIEEEYFKEFNDEMIRRLKLY